MQSQQYDAKLFFAWLDYLKGSLKSAEQRNKQKLFENEIDMVELNCLIWDSVDLRSNYILRGAIAFFSIYNKTALVRFQFAFLLPIG